MCWLKTLKKIATIHQQLYVAFSGNLNDCMSVFGGIAPHLSKSTSVEQCTTAVMNWIKESSGYHSNDFNAQLIIAGCNSFGQLKFNSVRCYDHELICERYNLTDTAQFTVCSALDASDDFITPLMNQRKSLLDQMVDVVKEAAKRNPSINDQIFYEIITDQMQ